MTIATPNSNGRYSLNCRLALRILCVFTALIAVISLAQFPTETQAAPQIENLIPEELQSDPLSAKDHAMVSELTGSIKAFEWLGPLAPIAISPFFGLACLCGISQYGGDWMPLNGFISDNPVLQNPYVLWAFVVLTLVTSLPRLTKVSKPLGQAIDQLEAWSGIVAIIVIRIASSMSDPAAESTVAAATPVVLECGIISFSADMLFSVAAIINILVINTVKFFFEVTVWLMPFPFVDALLEGANKAVCATLMAIYVWSPLVATILNLLIFVACFFAFRWISRRVTYMRSILFDPIWAMIQKSYGKPTTSQLTVFPQTEIGPFASREKVQLADADEGWELRKDRLLFESKSHSIAKESCTLKIEPGLFVNSIQIQAKDGASTSLLFSRRFNDHLDDLASLIGAEVTEPSDRSSVREFVLGT